MAIDSEGSYMPPLSEDMHEALRDIENEFRNKLASCCRSYRVHDPDLAFEYARTWAVKFFDCCFEYYSNFIAYQDRWSEASQKLALQRVKKCIDDIETIRFSFQTNRDQMLSITMTVSERAEEKEKTIPRRIVFDPEVSALPLPPNVWAQINATPKPPDPAENRKSVVQPILDEKGWSISDWATDAEVAYHTVDDYLSGRRNPYSSTRKKLAVSLGISIQELPS
jgi:hypothetical protein